MVSSMAGMSPAGSGMGVARQPATTLALATSAIVSSCLASQTKAPWREESSASGPVMHAMRRDRVTGPDRVRELHVEPTARPPCLSEGLFQDVRRVRHRHAPTHHDIAEAQLLRGVLVGVVVRVAMKELAAHLDRDRAREAAERLAVRNDKAPGSRLLARVPERHRTRGIRIRQKALVVLAAHDQGPGRVVQIHFVLHDGAVAALVDVANPAADRV